MIRRIVRRADEAADRPLCYRAYPPLGVVLPILLVVAVPVALSVAWLLDFTGGPYNWQSALTGILLVVLLNEIPRRKVMLSADGRLTITGIGRRVDVDARRLTAIRVTGRARKGFVGAVFVWDGGRFRLWPSMRRHPDPAPWYLKGRRPESVSEDFRDLVYRLCLANPGMTIEGVAPPADALPRPPVRHW